MSVCGAGQGTFKELETQGFVCSSLEYVASPELQSPSPAADTSPTPCFLWVSFTRREGKNCPPFPPSGLFLSLLEQGVLVAGVNKYTYRSSSLGFPGVRSMWRPTGLGMGPSQIPASGPLPGETPLPPKADLCHGRPGSHRVQKETPKWHLVTFAHHPQQGPGKDLAPVLSPEALVHPGGAVA